MKKILTISCLFCYITMYAQPPEVFVMDAQRLSEIKQRFQQHQTAAQQLVATLQKKADDALQMKPVSVMDKNRIPVSGNKHDYMSQAPYFWYDSSKPGGLPYLRRDGVRNPEIYKITDRTYLGQLENAVTTLSLAWYFTGDAKYADKAAILLRHWFLNADTKMNPHLEYGQAIPGINNGRGIGIIETRALMGIADAAQLLQGAVSWQLKDHAALQSWYKEYLNWLLTSANGNDEHRARNNHGTWFYAQAIDFALFTGNRTKAKELAEESRIRLDSQLTEQGAQPLELERTNALGYSTMNLRGWFDVATLAQKAGVDLWRFQTSKGANIQTALQWITPYATGQRQWPYQQIGTYSKNDIYILLLKAGKQFHNTTFTQSAAGLGNEIKDPMIALLYGKE